MKKVRSRIDGIERVAMGGPRVSRRVSPLPYIEALAAGNTALRAAI